MASRSAFGRDKNNTMPGTSRTQQKAEARYNVTTQFPQYDLHFAAASGNLGLVEFALSHGQPINSVLNGVLPLHAACAGGSEVVVKYLIDEGADVNAPRIPRRFSNEKHKSSGLAVGASGSTPLHFAAANGHLGVVKLLLAHGAVPDRADKHGVTPEMLARENGWVECADVLAAWSGGRSGDLPPVRDGESASNSGSGSGSGCGSGLGTGTGAKNEGTNGNGNANSGLERGEYEKERQGEKEKDRDGPGCEIAEMIQSGSRRLQMKRSIDNALHLFKTPLLSHHGSHGQLREREGKERDAKERSPPSPSTAAHPHSQHSIFPLLPQSHHHHSHHLPTHSHSHSHSHSHGGSPSPAHSHPHLHAIFHHGHSHSTSQLQSQSQVQSQSPAPAQAPGVMQSQSQPQSVSMTASGSNSSSSTTTATATANASPSLRPRLLGTFDHSTSASTPASFTPSLTASPVSSSTPISNPLNTLDALGVGFGMGVPSHRRPSLPQIFDEPPSPFQRRLSGRRRRPRSAGEDAEQGPASGAGKTVSGNVNGGANGRIGGTQPNSNIGTSGTTRKLSSKISLRNLFRRAGGDVSLSSNSNSNANLSGSEPGSSSASVSTSFSSLHAPIYSLAFASPNASSQAGVGAVRGPTSSTPPASPLSASFAPSPAPTTGGMPGRPGSWYRQRLGSEGAGSVPVPRSPLVPSAVELHNRYSPEHLYEEFEDELEAEAEAIGGVEGDSSEGRAQGEYQSRAQELTQVQAEGVREGSVEATIVAPRLSARPSILRGHNRSSSSQSSSGTGTPSGSGARTLRFDASSVTPPSASASPEPRFGMGTAGVNMNINMSASGIGLRGTRSASSLRHEHSFGYEEDEEEEEDYGTSINRAEEETSGILDYEDADPDAELEETTNRELAPPVDSSNYKYGPTGRARGASFTSTASSSPGVSPENTHGRAPYEGKEFPFSIERPPLTPISVTSELSMTTRHSLPDDATAENPSSPSPGLGEVLEAEEGKETLKRLRKSDAESRIRGESFSSVETDGSAPSRDGNASSSTSAFTNISTPSPGTDLRTPVLSGEDNDDSTDVPPTVKGEAPINDKRAIDGVYLHASPSSSMEELESPDVDVDADGKIDQPITASTTTTSKSLAPITPLDLDLRGISNLAEAEALVRRAQQAILASASLPADGPESPGIPLSAQLAAYGEILALERRFARGEKQREMWGMRDDSDAEGGDREPGALDAKAKTQADARMPLSAKEARMALTQKRRDAVTRQRGATTGAGSSLKQKGAGKPSKHKRPHTAEGAPQASWGVNRVAGSPSSTSMTGGDVVRASTSIGSAPHHLHSHSRSTSSPLYIGEESGKLPDISIIETTATPVDSPKTPDSVQRISPSPSVNASDYPHTRYTIDDARPSLPFRSRTPDPEASGSTDDFGVPLTRVSTAPLQDSTGYGSGSGSGSYNARGSSSILRSDPATRRTGAAHKLSKMGFSPHSHSHAHSHSASPGPRLRHQRSGIGRQKEIADAYVYSVSPASSAGSSRSPSKARFGGIKSLVRGLKGRS